MALAAARCSASVANWRPETATIEEWRAECLKVGLLDKDKPKPASALFSNCRLALIAANWIACNETIGLDAAELAGCGCQNRGSPDRCLQAGKQRAWCTLICRRYCEKDQS
jgi:hypothetical protein